jgi:hypothetical protein
MDDIIDMWCDDCHEAKHDVKVTTCPFTEEIYDKKISVTLCNDCYYERCMDI